MKILRQLTMTGRLLFGFAALVLVVLVVLYALSTFGATRIDGDHSSALQDTYTWTGESLILDNDTENRPVSCTVAPESGQTRDIRVDQQRANANFFTARRYAEVEPWFDGSAEITCDGDVDAHAGSGATLYGTTQSVLYRFGGPVLIGVPMALAVLFCRRKANSG